MAGPLVSDAPASPAPVDVRPNVLALPSPTVARFVLLLGALLSSGLFVGTWVHNQTAVGDDWLARVAECERQRPTLPSGAGAEEILAAQQSVLQCVEGAQQRLAWFALGGVALTLVAAGVVLAIVPRVIVRRRALRLAGPKLAAASERVAALAKEGGLRRSPDTMVGTSKLHDAFSFGLPGHYAVALPPAVAVRSTGVAFESLVRHELAHVARRDVLIAWSARALWYVLLALLALPVIVALARADVSLLPSYAWRAALLLGAAMLASAGILRSREFDADLGSTGTAARREALSSLLGTSGRAATTGWRRVVALHPDPSDRVLTLGDPARLARPSAVDAAIAGFLAAVTLPLLVSVFATVPSLTNWAYAVPAALVGPLMGVTVGLALWRRAMVDKAVSTAELPAAARRVAAGVFAGFLVGQTASLAAVGSETITGTRSPLLPLLGALALGGSTFVVAGLGGIAGDRSRRLSARGFTALAVVLSAIVFAFVLWAATMLASTLDLGGWALAALTIVTLLTQPAAVAVVAVLAAAVLVLLAVRPDNVPPVWAVEGDVSGTPAAGRRSVGLREVTAVGLASGIVAAACILGFRLLAGPAPTLEQLAQRFDAYVWVFAGAGLAAGLSLIALHGVRGAGAGVTAAALASCTAALGFVAINAGFGGDVTLDFVGGVVGPGLPVGLLLFVLASLLSALPIPDARGRRPLVILIVVAGLLGGAAAAGAIAARDTISPLQPSAPTGLSTHDYVSSYAPTVVAGVARVDQAAAAIDADSQLTPSERARRIRTDLVAPLDVLLRQAGAVTPGDDSVVQLHAALVAGLQGNRRAFENFARAYETSDSALFSRTQADRVGAQQLLRAWLDGVRARQTR
jgi:Zn-dependent protease with chaperone function